MEAGCDIATAYRTVPHTDLPRTGAQAARLLVRAMQGDIRPVVRSARLAMAAPADRQDSTEATFAGLMGLADAAERQPGVLAAAFLPSHPWRDVPELGWAAIATADGDPAMAERAAAEIADAAWALRRWFTAGQRPPIGEALRIALEGPAPVVLADAGDSPTGGSMGDSTELLRAALAYPERHIWLALTDAAAAAVATSAGVGARLRLVLGAGSAGDHNAATQVEADVLALPDGHLTYVGPYARGVSGDMGQSALAGHRQRAHRGPCAPGHGDRPRAVHRRRPRPGGSRGAAGQVACLVPGRVCGRDRPLGGRRHAGTDRRDADAAALPTAATAPVPLRGPHPS